MDKINLKLLSKIENALNIKFYDWQKDYILDIPRVLDIRTTGRKTGKTLAYIIKLLFSEDKPIRAYDSREICNCSDWFCYYTQPDPRAPYTQFFRMLLSDIYIKLIEKNIKPRPVFFCRKDEDIFHLKSKDRTKRSLLEYINS